MRLDTKAVYASDGTETALSKRTYRKNRRRKLKKEEDFKVGRIKKWNEFFNGRGNCMDNQEKFKDQVEESVWNKKSEWKVYSRRTKKKKR